MDTLKNLFLEGRERGLLFYIFYAFIDSHVCPDGGWDPQPWQMEDRPLTSGATWPGPHLCVLFCRHVFSSLGSILMSGIAGSNGNTVISYFKELPNCFSK